MAAIGKLMEWLEIDHPPYVGCLQHFFRGGNGKTDSPFKFIHVICHILPVNVLRLRTKCCSFLKERAPASVSSEEVRLIGFKSGKLTSVVTSWSLTSFLVGILIFFWAVLLKHRVLLLLLLGCMVWSNCSGWRSVASENLWRALFFRAISSATICSLTSLQTVSAIFSHCHERDDRAGNVISLEGLWS